MLASGKWIKPLEPRSNVIRVSQGQISLVVLKNTSRDFPGGSVVKNPPANAGDPGSIPGPGGSHMSLSN